MVDRVFLNVGSVVKPECLCWPRPVEERDAATQVQQDGLP